MKKTKFSAVLVLLTLFCGSNNSASCIASQDYNSTMKPHIECLTNVDCGSHKVCHNNVCEPCRLEGKFSPDLTLCCEGSNHLDVDNRCVFVCELDDDCFVTIHTSQEDSSEEIKNILGYVFGLVGSIFLFVMIILAALYTVLSENKKRVSFIKRIFAIATAGFVVSLFAILCLMVLDNMGF